MSELIIKLMPQGIYEQLHGCEYKGVPRYELEGIQRELEKYGLTELVDDSELVNLPIPKISKPLTQWIEKKIQNTYIDYFEEADLFRDLVKDYGGTFFQDFKRPAISPFKGWSKFVNGNWEPCNGVPASSIVFDFETVRKSNLSIAKPFMCAAIDTDEVVYSWLGGDDWDELPLTVDFGDQILLFIGHNCVSYDRRYVKQFYKFGHKCRMFDTYSFYHVVLGMSKKQSELYRIFKYKETKPRWCQVTTSGSLANLAKFLCDIDLDKSVRDKFLSGQVLDQEIEESDISFDKNQNINPDGLSEIIADELEGSEEGIKDDLNEFNNYKYILDNLSSVWDYCVNDVLATACVYEKLYNRVSRYPSKIYLAGQLERSTIRIGVVPDLEQKIDVVRGHNCARLKEINSRVVNCLSDKMRRKNPILGQRIQGFLTKDWYERIFKSSSFPYKKNLEQFEDVELPSGLIALGWEKDNSGSKRSKTKNNTVLKLKAVQHAINTGYKTKISKADAKKWLKKIQKEPNQKINIHYISLSGKDTPVILGMKWNDKPLEIRGNTWGIILEDGTFEPLPHPKGANKNVGTPIGKEFEARVKAREITADVDLNELFEDISETTLWEKFEKRFQEIYIVDGVWLPEMVPSGTVTGRSAGALAVVMANTKPNRAGSEMKTWFRTGEGMVKISADYSGQESEIFAAHIDAVKGHSGLNVFSCLVHAGKQENKTDIHNVVARMLSDADILKEKEIVIKRQIAKNMNFANQFLCGRDKLALMVYLGLNGFLSMDDCLSIATRFQETTRGKQEYGKYYDGMASIGFNRLKEMAKESGQYCRLTGRKISDPLDAKWIEKDELTTRANFSIQGTGQGLVDICMIVTRILATTFDVKYNLCQFIHDECGFETDENNGQNMAWIMQIAHLFSKALMYYRFGVQSMPINKMFFETVEVDTILRKSPVDPGITPSNIEPLPHIWSKSKDCLENIYSGQIGNSKTMAILKAEDCRPDTRILELLDTIVL